MCCGAPVSGKKPEHVERLAISINMQTKLCSTTSVQPDGENEHNIHKMCP